jgi:hypothetical protein
MAYASDLKSLAFGHAGSNPASGTDRSCRAPTLNLDQPYALALRTCRDAPKRCALQGHLTGTRQWTSTPIDAPAAMVYDSRYANLDADAR